MDPLTIALNGLRSAIQALPGGLASAFNLPIRPSANQGGQGGIGGTNYAAQIAAFTRPLEAAIPALARFGRFIEIAGHRADAFNHLARILAPPRPTNPITAFQALAQSPWGQLARGAAGRLGNLLPAGQTLQGYIARQATGVLTQALLGTAGGASGVLGRAAIQNILGPQVAAGLQAKLGQLQAHVQGRGFQTTFGVQVSDAVSAGLRKAHAAFNPTGAAAASGWARVGAMIARGVAIGGAAAGVIGLPFVALHAVQELRRFAEGVNAANRALAPFNSQIGVAFARLDINEFARLQRTASLTADTSITLVQSIDRMRNAWLGFDIFERNLGNRGGIAGAELSGAIGDQLSRIAGALDQFLNKIDPKGGGAAAVGGGIGNWLLDFVAGGGNPIVGAQIRAQANKLLPPPVAPAAFVDNGAVLLRNMAAQPVNRPRAAPAP